MDALVDHNFLRAKHDDIAINWNVKATVER